ncbi:tetratricopeptide repeat protein [Armatimonas sp.]|uniref:tetratricopeptide repeat protein n=1 Tax=Armatimonas sp. TaxID=1872638 RepID=UPI00286B6D36|nr:tetratricopeptide repeat protein [Armatimonas sp.]
MSRLVTVGAVSALVLVLGAGSNAWAQDDLTTATDLISKGKYAEAIKVLDKLIKERPEASTLYFHLGRAHFGAKNLPLAEVAFTKVIVAKPLAADSYYNRGIVRSQLNNYTGAIADFTELIKLAPKPKANAPDLVLESYDSRVVAYLQTNKFSEAIADATKVLELDPKRGLTLLNRGYAYEKLNQFDKAVADYSAAVMLLTSDADKAATYFSKADLEFLKLNQLQPAIDDYTKGLVLDKSNTGALLNRAACNFQLKNFSAALADYNAALALKPGDAEITKNRAAVQLQLKDYKSAIVDYSAYLQKVGASADFNVYRLRAACYLNIEPKNYAAASTDLKAYLAKKSDDAVAWKDLALAQYNNIVPQGGSITKVQAVGLSDAIASAGKATQLDPKQADAFIIMADSYSFQEKYKEAVPPYTSYIALQPDKPFGYEGLGRVQYNLQDYKGAATNFEKYLKFKPNDMEVKKLLALAKASGGGISSTEKIAALTEAISADPKDPGAYTNRGVAYFEAQDFDKAIADFKKALELLPAGSPNQLQYLNNLASAAGKKADKTQADADYRVAVDAYGQLLAKSPNNGEALGAQAFLYLKLKQWDSAMASYAKYLATNPTDQKEQLAALTNRAYCALQKSPADFASAIADYTKIIALAPTDPKAYELRGRTYLDMKNLAAAASDFDKVLQLSGSKDPEMVKNQAVIYFNLGENKRKINDASKGLPEFEKAIANYTTYLASKPTDAIALYGRGLAIYRKAKASTDVKVKLAELKKASADFEAATKADPKYADAWYYLGLSYDDYGVADELSQETMFPKAIAAYEKYVTLPGVPAADVDAIKKRITQLKDAL